MPPPIHDSAHAMDIDAQPNRWEMSARRLKAQFRHHLKALQVKSKSADGAVSYSKNEEKAQLLCEDHLEYMIFIRRMQRDFEEVERLEDQLEELQGSWRRRLERKKEEGCS